MATYAEVVFVKVCLLGGRSMDPFVCKEEVVGKDSCVKMSHVKLKVTPMGALICQR